MFRTRDFILVFSTVVFLIVAIGATLLKQRTSSGEDFAMVKFAETTDQEYVAEVEEKGSVSREERVSNMRDKISASNDLVLTNPEPVPVDEVPEEEIIEDDEPALTTGVQKCPGYTTYLGSWTPQGVVFEETEGARVVYRAGFEVVGTSTVAAREVLLQLPAAPVKSGENCLATDVIGIAKDGSLIKNDEVRLYGVFGSDTLIGYALDGFPIYGVAGNPGDTCGGGVVAASYRYTLAASRDTIINCFAAPPVTL